MQSPHAKLISLLKVTASAKPLLHEKLYTDGPPGLYLVQSGLVRTHRVLSVGTDIHLDLHPPNTFFGEFSLGGKPRDEIATVLQADTTLLFWNLANLRAQLSYIQPIAEALFELALERAQRSEVRYIRSETLLTRERFIENLIDVAVRIGPKLAGDIWIPWLSQEVYASMVGTSREIATAIVNQLKREGFIRSTDRKGMTVSGKLLELPQKWSAAAC